MQRACSISKPMEQIIKVVMECRVGSVLINSVKGTNIFWNCVGLSKDFGSARMLFPQ